MENIWLILSVESQHDVRVLLTNDRYRERAAKNSSNRWNAT